MDLEASWCISSFHIHVCYLARAYIVLSCHSGASKQCILARACLPHLSSGVYQVRRLLPKQDPVRYLASNPGSVLSMAQAGLESAIDGNLV